MTQDQQKHQYSLGSVRQVYAATTGKDPLAKAKKKNTMSATESHLVLCKEPAKFDEKNHNQTQANEDKKKAAQLVKNPIEPTKGQCLPQVLFDFWKEIPRSAKNGYNIPLSTAREWS